MASKLLIYDKGFTLRRNRTLPAFKGGGRRGRLVGKYSNASFRRLRDFAIRFGVDADCWGLTLTVPGLDILSDEEFRSMHHKLCVYCNDNGIPCIWRVELQQRGQPHLHMVVFSSVERVVRLMSHWYKLLDSCPEVFSPEFVSSSVKEVVSISRSYVHGSVHAVDLQKLSAGFDAFRYLVSHMSKSKQAQMGWRGRNWGVCNRKLFSASLPDSYEFEDDVYYAILRCLRRLTGRRITPRSGCSSWVSNPATMRSIYDYAISKEDVFDTSVMARSYWLYSWYGLMWVRFLSDAFIDSVVLSIRRDCITVLFDLLFMSLRWQVLYCDFVSPPLIPCVEVDGKFIETVGRRVDYRIVKRFRFPSHVKTASDKIHYFFKLDEN